MGHKTFYWKIVLQKVFEITIRSRQAGFQSCAGWRGTESPVKSNPAESHY